MRRSLVIAGAGLWLVSVVSACGDATATGAATFTSAQVTEIAKAIDDAVVGGITQGAVFGTTATITETVNCTGGGSSLVKGTTDGGANNNLTVTFSGCHTTNLVVDGSVTFVETQAANGGATTTTRTGDLTISGTASGTCHITATSFCGVTTS